MNNVILIIGILCSILILSMAYHIRSYFQIKRLKNYLSNIQTHDSLTLLPNHILFHKIVKNMVHKSLQAEKSFALIVLNVDFLEKINEQYGRFTGDVLLKQMVKRLRNNAKEGMSIARIGEDKFAITIDNLPSDEYVEKWVHKILQLLKVPYFVNQQEIYASVSAGIVSFPQSGKHFHELVASANAALEKAIAQNRGSYYFLKKNVFQNGHARNTLQSELHQAIELNQFELYYQPQFRLSDMKFIGLECLLRWRRSHDEMVPPSVFIPMAEKMGLMYSITEWVVLNALAQFSAWRDTKLNGFTLAINLTLEKFQTEKFLDYLKDKLIFYNINPKNLEFEMTEAVVTELITDSKTQLDQMPQIGMQLAIDDFGTGYSSLDRLCQLPINTLKIDQSFVHDMFSGSKNKLIIETIIDLGRDLGFNVLAEGIETEEQLAFLKSKNCQFGQGYFYSKPLNTADTTAFLKSHLYRGHRE